MKILFLTHSFPFPPNDGMRSTCSALIQHLSRNNDTTLLSLIESEEEKKHIPEIQKWCRRVEVVRHTVPRSPWRRLKNIFWDSAPFCVTQFYSAEFSAKLRNLLREEKFDLVHFFSVNISGYLADLGNTPGLFFPHDSVSMQFHRNAKLESNLLRKFYLYSQARKMKDYEKEVIRKFAQTVIVSDVDRKWIAQFVPDACNAIAIIPGGVDPDRFPPQTPPEDAQSPPSVLFRGVMNFLPNQDAALYFHSEILPLVLKEVPDLCYTIIGKEPPPSVRKLHDGRRVFVTGLVDDLRPYMAKATVHICPMRAGSGMKNKILEAWAMEKPVVATSLACDGIAVQHGQHLLIADSAESFAQSVIDLIKNPDLRKKLGKNGRELAIQKYTWAYSASLFQKLYENMVQTQATVSDWKNLTKSEARAKVELAATVKIQ